ncbi:MAG: chemotaxis response regulator protein-glutamate methylesterase [Burkholderiaceae bacterium]|jgi:two-component system chemotaxis response regulator CheB|nr:chemotaxis response regulator protein-glutamate methylesterase [Burkholderiales bacterium]MCA3215426.1 chemotaxis response regulator protein-glutamate methylesterase [Burkholderiales bacterium]MCE2645163.1 chemotaxis response regulator protein-glutamate methylesterase [Burkholderiaceae bacterium]
MSKTRVLIIDDSALVRSLLSEIINKQPDMEAIGAAPDPMVAREMIRAMNPDVLTLDVEMPRMDGLDFLERLMRLRPTPVVMVSTLTQRGAETTLRALELGAIDFVSKPKIGIASGLTDLAQDICEKIRVASRARMQRHVAAAPAPQDVAGEAKPRPLNFSRLSTEKLIIIGASTGGTEAIREVLVRLPADSPAVLITQHMPVGFTKSFAARLDSLCKISVSEAVDGERVLPGHAYIAPGDRHMKLARSGANYVVQLDDGPPVNRHRPSVEVLFRSAAVVAGRNAFGLMLTGMGKDGAAAMVEMRQAGSYNIAQDEATCVVYGMPREAVLLGAVDEVLPIGKIAGRLLEKLAEMGGAAHRV